MSRFWMQSIWGVWIGVASLISVQSVSAKSPASRGAVPKADVRKVTVPIRKLRYSIYLKGKKVGFIRQTERYFPNGKVIVEGQSTSVFRIWFVKVDTKMSFRSVFHKGTLIHFRLNRLQRGKRLKIQARRTSKGFRVEHTLDSKRQVRVFASSSFDGTSRELKAPMQALRSTLKRRILNFVELKIIQQTLSYKKKMQIKIAGKSKSAVLVKAKGPRGTASMFFSAQGALLKSFASIRMVGRIRVVLDSVKGSYTAL